MKTTAIDNQIQFKNILFATDFSAAASAAEPFVKDLARHYESIVVALYVRPPVVNPMTQPAGWDEQIAAAKAADEQHRSDLLNSFAGVPTKVIIEEGPLDACFKKAIEKNKIDLLVMGTHARRGVRKLLLGSVAEELFREVMCPVMTIGPDALFCDTPFTEFKHVLYATALNPLSKVTARYAEGLAREYKAKLTVLHILSPKEKNGVGRERESLQKLQSLVPAWPELNGTPEYLVEHGDTSEVILDTADLVQADLIVLGAHPEAGVPGAATHLPISTAHQVVARAKCPVLTIRN
jgi:nucleotide-binding universal stress UspA family protein